MSLWIIVAVAMVVMLAAWIVSYVDDWSRDWNTNVAETTVEANDTNLRPINSTLSPQKLADATLAAVSTLRRWSVVEKSELEPNTEMQPGIRLKLLHSTLLMHFKDDVTVTILGTDGGSVLNARSQSRIGKGDLGQNPRNLRQLHAAVRRELEKREISSQ